MPLQTEIEGFDVMSERSAFGRDCDGQDMSCFCSSREKAERIEPTCLEHYIREPVIRLGAIDKTVPLTSRRWCRCKRRHASHRRGRHCDCVLVFRDESA
jgi:hypothetical protein